MPQSAARADRAETDVDVLIVGAGISGIGMAVHLKQHCPGKSFVMLERRDDIGGTWHLFQYPGIRSDSDMHTLGYVFEPWTEQKAIADGPSIQTYLQRIKAKHKLEAHLRLGHKVLSARWSSAAARWTIEAETAEGRAVYTANFLYMGSGYYDYDEGHDPQIPGIESFAGDVIHPQFWPRDYDYAGKRIVVIGSGATAVTIVPSVADKAAHVTMLQRTPTWFFVRDAEDKLANRLRRWLGEELAYKLIRFRNVRLQHWGFRQARKRPQRFGERLLKPIRDTLGDRFEPRNFTPPYDPWEQRLCLVPDNDLFEAVRQGKADIVTDRIETVTETGIRLASGQTIAADTIVTATGLKLAMAGKVAFEVDGTPIDFARSFYYKGCMFANVPNMAIVFGYLNASWTLKTDIVCNFVCRLLKAMDARGADIANPVLADPDTVEEEDLFDFSSGYIARARELLPRNAKAMPWRLTQDYLFERKVLLTEPVDDGVMVFSRATGHARAEPETAIAAE